MNPPESSPEIRTRRQLGAKARDPDWEGSRGEEGAGCDTRDLGRRAWVEAPGKIMVQALANRHDRSMEAAYQEGGH